MSLKLFLPVLILIPLIVLAFVYKTSFSNGSPSSPSSSASALPANLPAGASAKAGVTVSAEYLPNLSSAEFIVFQVSLNTHSVSLDNIDFQKSVVLEKSGQQFSPVEAIVEGSNHHRSAEVKFNRVSTPLKIIFLETSEAARQEFMFDELKW